MRKPIFDSMGKPVKIVTSVLHDQFEQRNSPLSGAGAPHGSTMLSKFAGTDKKIMNQRFPKFAADIETANPAIRSPLLNQSNFYMPESDVSTGEPNRLLNQWLDYYYKWGNSIGNIIDLHSELPLSRFALRGVEDPEILRFYEQMVEDMELHLKMIDLLKYYFLKGEVAPFAFWNDNLNCWSDLTFLDTNYLFVKGHYLLHSDDGDDVEFYELEPDPMLRQIVQSDDYVTKMLRQYLDDEFVSAVRQNKRLLLSNFSTYMIKHKVKSSDLRGTSIVLRCLKSLLYGDKLRESQYSIADGHVNPKWVWKIGQAGDLATGGYMPSEEDLSAFRDLLIEANNDPIFTIITHYAVNVDAVGLNGKLLPLAQEYSRIDEEILTALFANKAVTTGSGPNFATASVAFRAMMSRYIPIRARVERYNYQKIFAPVAYANQFYKRRECDLKNNVRTGDDTVNELIIPQIDWRSKSNLLDDGTVKSIISSSVNSGRLPMKILVDALDLDYEEVRSYLYREQASVFDPVAIEARKRAAAQQKDATMMGQPWLPKTNQPVPVSTEPEVTAKKAAKNGNGKKGNGKIKRSDLLTVQPLPGDAAIQTKIDQGKPECGGDPEEPDIMEESMKLDKAAKDDGKPIPKVFELHAGRKEKDLGFNVVKKAFDSRNKHKNRLTADVDEKSKEK